jgi:hypothetical protein
MACWIPKATNTHSDYVTCIAFSLQQWLHKRASLLRYTYIVSLVKIYFSNVHIVHSRQNAQALFSIALNKQTLGMSFLISRTYATRPAYLFSWLSSP